MNNPLNKTVFNGFRYFKVTKEQPLHLVLIKNIDCGKLYRSNFSQLLYVIYLNESGDYHHFEDNEGNDINQRLDGLVKTFCNLK